MTFDATTLIELIIKIIGILFFSVLIPYLRSKTSKEQQDEINAWVKIAVTAAEQIYRGTGRGSEKKEYVIKWLADHKVTYDSAKIDAMIEAAVYDLKVNNLFNTNASENIVG